jgi:hypothetical protein
MFNSLANSYREGDRVTLNGVNGTVRNLGLLTASVALDNGEFGILSLNGGNSQMGGASSAAGAAAGAAGAADAAADAADAAAAAVARARAAGAGAGVGAAAVRDSDIPLGIKLPNGFKLTPRPKRTGGYNLDMGARPDPASVQVLPELTRRTQDSVNIFDVLKPRPTIATRGNLIL